MGKVCDKCEDPSWTGQDPIVAPALPADEGGGMTARIVDELPEKGETGYIYFVLKEVQEEGNIYDEYMWMLQEDGTTYDWEHIGISNEISVKLYQSTGQNADGAMSQKATTDALNTKANSSSLAAVATSGAYSDLSGTPTVPSVVQTTGNSETNVMSQKAVTDELATAGKGLTTLSYGHSTWQEFLDAYNAGKIVYCAASSNADPSTGSQGRLAFMAFVTLNGTTPTKVEFQYVRSVSSKSATDQCDQVFVYTLANTNGGTWTVATRDMASTVAAGTNAERSYSGTTVTINPRLYTTTGQNTNGGITQKLFTDTVGNIESALNAINNGGNA